MPKLPKWASKPVWAKIIFRLPPRCGRITIRGAFENYAAADAYAKTLWAPGSSYQIECLAPATKADLLPGIPVDLKDASGPEIVVVDKKPTPFVFPFGEGHTIVMR